MANYPHTHLHVYNSVCRYTRIYMYSISGSVVTTVFMYAPVITHARVYYN